MNITFIGHSGYMVEINKNIFLFDYYTGIIPEELFNTKKNVIIFSSHSHFDHYNPEILKLQKRNPKIKYVFSSDIKSTGCNSLDNITFMDINECITIEDITIRTFKSTDLGVAFLVQAEKLGIFHAGDLNLWHWKEESSSEYVEIATREFLDIIKDVSKYEIDVAMFPTDPRMGVDYFEGSEIFIKEVRPKVFIPMHFNPKETRLDDFLNKVRAENLLEILIPSKENELFSVKNNEIY